MEEARNATRGRGMGEIDECVAVNPIDRCWRCDKDWAQNRFRLAKCAMGFGREATGGLGGEIYVVTDESDEDVKNPKPGTLRWGAIQLKPLWITFGHSMVINLQQELLVNSDKTIDGRGANVQIRGGGGITLSYSKNVIIHNIRIRNIKSKTGGEIRDTPTHYGFRTRSDGDAISLFGASKVWIDHVSLSNADDGLVDLIMYSTAVTISNCHLTKHDDVMLFGANDLHVWDVLMQVTVAFNHFGQGLTERMPRVRYGWIHVVNNHYTHWQMYAIGGSTHPTIVSQGNRFIAPSNPDAKEVTKREYTDESVWRNWQWTTEKDEMVNGAVFVPSGKPLSPDQTKNLVPPRDGSEVRDLTRDAGALNCIEGRPC